MRNIKIPYHALSLHNALKIKIFFYSNMFNLWKYKKKYFNLYQSKTASVHIVNFSATLAFFVYAGKTRAVLKFLLKSDSGNILVNIFAIYGQISILNLKMNTGNWKDLTPVLTQSQCHS